MGPKLSRNTLAFGVTSFLVDVSSEMLTPIMPLFLLNVLKANAFVIGLIEGVSDLIVASFRAFSGYISDKIGRRKGMSTIGYFISSIMKMFFVFATSWPQVLGIRMVERFGKGIRGVPRDAIISYSERTENLGKAFGYRKMMDAAGAILGPIIALAIAAYFLPALGEEMTYRVIFAIAVFPAMLGVLIIWRFVSDVGDMDGRDGKSIIKGVWHNEGYRDIVVLGILFGLAQFGNAFFILKAHEITGSVLITLVGYTIYNISYTLSAMPVGALTDRLGGKKMMALAYILFAVTLTGFAIANDLVFLLFFAVFGIVAAIMETTPRAFIARTVDHNNYGTAIGFYQGATGILVLPANLIAGILWDWQMAAGLHATFVFSFIISVSAAVLMLWRCAPSLPVAWG